jgi:hypothetical protein
MAVCIMAGVSESSISLQMKLAVAVANGMSVKNWATRNEVPVRTAYEWAAQPDLLAEINLIRRRALDEAIGLLAKNATPSVKGIVKLSKDANSESVKLSACRAVFSDFIAVSKYNGIEGRIAKLEEESRERDRNAS